MNQPKKIGIMGSTGSIGRQALQVVEEFPDLFKAELLIAGRNVELLIEQARRFRPRMAVIADLSRYNELRDALEPLGIETAAGEDEIVRIIRDADFFSMLLNSTVGYSGLRPTISAIEGGKDVALANKESLVVAGSLVNALLKKHGRKLFPVDSEHSAIWQCLVGEDMSAVRKLIITASGGPFRTFTPEQLENVTVADALRHPNWSMGAKITIDSATLMNKAFEIIEAYWLFRLPADRITAVVHPQSVIHSLVEFDDGAVKAQLGVPDMRLPIRYALAEGKRLLTSDEPLSLLRYHTLTFEEPDSKRFPCINLAPEALKKGGTHACAINAANEVAVASFLAGKIRFTDIYPLIRATVDRVDFYADPALEQFIEVNSQARRQAEQLVNTKLF